MDTIDEVVASTVRALRAERQVSVDLAAKTLGVEPIAYMKLEAGIARFSARHLYALSTLFHVKADAFFPVKAEQEGKRPSGTIPDTDDTV